MLDWNENLVERTLILSLTILIVATFFYMREQNRKLVRRINNVEQKHSAQIKFLKKSKKRCSKSVQKLEKYLLPHKESK